MKKILIGVVVGLIFTTGVGAGDMSPEWMKKHETKNAKYLGAVHFGIRGGFKGGNRIIKNNTGGMGVVNKEYLKELKQAQYYSARKIVITQKNPCFIVPFDVTKQVVDYKFMKTIKKIEKISKHKLTAYVENRGYVTTLNASDRRDLTDYKRHNYYPLPNVIDSTNSKIILGNSFECLKESNEETWEVYWKVKDRWVLMAEEKFFLSGSSVRKKIKKSKIPTITHRKSFQQPHVSTTNKPKNSPENTGLQSLSKVEQQKTRIRIYKYGAPDGFGRTFNSASDCEAERAKLTESHKGLDYEYKCEKM